MPLRPTTIRCCCCDRPHRDRAGPARVGLAAAAAVAGRATAACAWLRAWRRATARTARRGLRLAARPAEGAATYGSPRPRAAAHRTPSGCTDPRNSAPAPCTARRPGSPQPRAALTAASLRAPRVVRARHSPVHRSPQLRPSTGPAPRRRSCFAGGRKREKREEDKGEMRARERSRKR